MAGSLSYLCLACYLWGMNKKSSYADILESGAGRPIPDFCHLAWADNRLTGGGDGLPKLLPEERREMEQMGSSSRRREFRISRALIGMLAETAGLDADRLEIRREEGGKPFGRWEGRRIHLSVSHSPEKVICALSEERDIGLDIEYAGRETGEGLRERMLHTGEREFLKTMETIRIWTLKEALLKLDGRGLGTNMNMVRITGGENGSFEARFNNEIRAKICSFRHEDHWIALAYYL